jgi:hypothetical protein
MLRKYRRSQSVPAAVTGRCYPAFVPVVQSPPVNLAAMPVSPRILIGGVALPFVLDNSPISQFGLNGPAPSRFAAGFPRPALSRVFAPFRRLARTAETAARD